MAQTIIDSDLIVRGALKANSIDIPSNAVGNTQFKSTDPLAADKQDHQFLKTLCQAHGTAAVAGQCRPACPQCCGPCVEGSRSPRSHRRCGRHRVKRGRETPLAGS